MWKALTLLGSFADFICLSQTKAVYLHIIELEQIVTRKWPNSRHCCSKSSRLTQSDCSPVGHRQIENSFRCVLYLSVQLCYVCTS